MSGHTSVKQFIRNVRAAKTIADERAVIQKESASIRASFREESHDASIRSAIVLFLDALLSITLPDKDEALTDSFRDVGATTSRSSFTYLPSARGHISARLNV